MAARKMTTGRALLGLLAVVVAWGAQQLLGEDVLAPGATPPTTTAPARTPEPARPTAPGRAPTARQAAGGEQIVRLFEQGRSDVVLEAEGRVVKVLPDDNHGSRHQRLIVEVANDHTILLSHNIDLAPRVPVRRGERISFRGEYEWNDLGGVIHWTHHDPQRRRRGGWIEHEGERYE